ncbi:MAG: hypothetical protein QOG62_1502 [Thermoleophilaceae bacterium]|jgi:predicted unusual protein kinase regulating ubiquinone biosynthesis (AarF/ABC1/UbiB family)|nr:hypothetical protein [Thermoleophilaceae bacterium]
MADQRDQQRYIDAADSVLKIVASMTGASMKARELVGLLDPELVPPEFRDVHERALATLGGAPEGMNWKDVEKTLKRETGGRLSNTFAQIDETPATPASIGQVHRATLGDGREVAVKVQYPGAAEAVTSDLQNIGLILRAVQLVAPAIDAAGLAREIRDRVGEELDYEWEAQAQRRFARAYKGDSSIHIPAPMTDLSTSCVLISEWVDGRGIDQLSGDERGQVAETVFRFYHGNAHRVGAYNCDPHPDNFRLMADGRVAFLDFGSILDVPADRLARITALRRAAAAGDAEGTRDLLVELGYFGSAADLAPDVALELVTTSSGWLLQDHEVSVDRDMVRALMDQGAPLEHLVDVATVPPPDLMRMRLDVTLLMTLARLGATRNWHRIALECWDRVG